MKRNDFSLAWYALFYDRIEPKQTKIEVAFLERYLPLASHSIILNSCCGRERPMNAIAKQGYHVTGIDNKEAVIASAKLAACTTAPAESLCNRPLQSNLFPYTASLIDLATERPHNQNLSKLIRQPP